METSSSLKEGHNKENYPIIHLSTRAKALRKVVEGESFTSRVEDDFFTDLDDVDF
jgi:hypothetical protein